MKKIMSILLVLVLLVTALPLSASAIANPFGDAWVKTGNGKSVNVRRTPATANDNVMKQLPYGTKVEIVGYEKGTQWALCDIGNGIQGYIMSRYLVRTNPGKYNPKKPDPAPKKDEAQADSYNAFKYVEPYAVTVRPSNPTGFVNMRWAPDKTVKVIEKYYQGAELTVIAVGKKWCQVRDEVTGYTGFMMSAFLVK